MIKDSVHIQFNGTFCVVPKMFLQLFTLFIHVNGHTLPAIHVIMTRKTETLYRAAILAIRELISNFNPIFAMRDFELAPRKVLKKIFPSIRTIGCWFHFTKQFMRKFRKLDCQNCIKQTKHY